MPGMIIYLARTHGQYAHGKNQKPSLREKKGEEKTKLKNIPAVLVTYIVAQTVNNLTSCLLLYLIRCNGIFL